MNHSMKKSIMLIISILIIGSRATWTGSEPIRWALGEHNMWHSCSKIVGYDGEQCF